MFLLFKLFIDIKYKSFPHKFKHLYKLLIVLTYKQKSIAVFRYTETMEHVPIVRYTYWTCGMKNVIVSNYLLENNSLLNFVST